MKTTISNITKNPAYAEHYATLQHLDNSLAEAQAEVERTSATLRAWVIPTGQDAVSTALAMIDGRAPARHAMDNASVEHANAERKARIIKDAITQQHATLTALAATLSGEVAVSLRGEHAEAVRAVANALKALDAALESEEVIRDSIIQAGYRCTFPPFVILEIGRLKQPQSLMEIRYREANNYVTDYEDHVSGKIDKAVTVHLLTDAPGIGRVTEIVNIAGRIARHLVRMGRAEETTDKPIRVAKQRHDNTGDNQYGLTGEIVQ